MIAFHPIYAKYLRGKICHCVHMKTSGSISTITAFNSPVTSEHNYNSCFFEKGIPN